MSFQLSIIQVINVLIESIITATPSGPLSDLRCTPLRGLGFGLGLGLWLESGLGSRLGVGFGPTLRLGPGDWNRVIPWAPRLGLGLAREPNLAMEGLDPPDVDLLKVPALLQFQGMVANHSGDLEWPLSGSSHLALEGSSLSIPSDQHIASRLVLVWDPALILPHGPSSHISLPLFMNALPVGHKLGGEEHISAKHQGSWTGT